MSYIPAALRRTGYHFPQADVSVPARGFCALPIEHQHALHQGVEYVRQLGDRALAELLLELAGKRADLPGTIETLADWRRRLTPEMTRAARADAFPTRVLQRVA